MLSPSNALPSLHTACMADFEATAGAAGLAAATVAAGAGAGGTALTTAGTAGLAAAGTVPAGVCANDALASTALMATKNRVFSCGMFLWTRGYVSAPLTPRAVIG